MTSPIFRTVYSICIVMWNTRDGNGLITRAEWKQSLIDMGANEDVGHVEKWMELSDKDGNGGIDLEEYKAFIQSK